MNNQKIVNYVMHTPGNTNPTILKQMLEETSVQSDWNQNDSTKPDYVKSRPFYSEMLKKVLIEQTATFVENPELGVCAFECSVICNFIVGEAYRVLWDGVEYTCVAFDAGAGMGVIGNLALFPGGEPNTNEPFLMFPSDSGLIVLTHSTGEHSFKVVGNVEEIHHLDTKYMPISYGVLVLPNIGVLLGSVFDGNPIVIDNAEKVWGYIKQAAEKLHLIVLKENFPPLYCTETPKHNDGEEYCYYGTRYVDANPIANDAYDKNFSLEFRYNTGTKQLSIIGGCDVTKLATA